MMLVLRISGVLAVAACQLFVAPAFASPPRFAAVVTAAPTQSRVEADLPADASNQLSLADALARARSSVAETILARAQLEIQSAQTQADTRWSSVGPSLEVDLRPGINAGTQGSFGWAALGNYQFDAPGAPRARVQEGKARIAAASARLVEVEQEAKRVVLRAYVQAQISRVRMQQAKHSQTIAKELEQVATERARLGAGSDIEIASAELAVQHALGEVHAARSDVDATLSNLAYLLDVPEVSENSLTTDISRPKRALDASKLVRTGLSSHPALVRLRSELSLARQTELRLDRESRPGLGLVVGADAAPASPIFAVVGATVNFPSRRVLQGQISVSRAQSALQETQVALATRRMSHRIELLAGRHKQALTRLELIQSQALPTAAHRHELVSQGWRAGRFDIIKVTTSLQELNEVRAEMLRVLAEVWAVQLELAAEVGSWSPSDFLER